MLFTDKRLFLCMKASVYVLDFCIVILKSPGAASQALAKVHKEHGCEKTESYAEGRDSFVRVGQ